MFEFQLSYENRKAIAIFVQKYLMQLTNVAFGAILDPKEALGFIYERVYFAYATDKQAVINNIQKLEALYSNIPENNFKERMILKITRPIIKINFLINLDKTLLSMIEFPAKIDFSSTANLKSIKIYSDYIISCFIKELFQYKQTFGNSSKDEIAEFVTKAIDAIGIHEGDYHSLLQHA